MKNMARTSETDTAAVAANAVADRAKDMRNSKKSGSGSTRARVASFLEAYILVVLLVAMTLFFCFWPETSSTFPTLANLRILLSSQVVIGVISLGVMVTLLTKEFDLSVGMIAALTGVMVAQFATDTGSSLAAFGLALLIGLVIGGLNAFIVTRLHVNGVIATLGMATILTGVILQQTGGLAVSANIPDLMSAFGTGDVAGVPIIFLALLVIAGLVYFMLGHTSLGRKIYAVGSNIEAAKLVGLRTDGLRATAFVLGAVLCAVGGFLYVSRAGGASPNVGNSFLLPAFAAAFLSAAAVKPGRFNVWGLIIAVYFLAVLNNGLSLAGLPPYVNDWVNGIALIVGVAVSTLLYRRRTS